MNVTGITLDAILYAEEPQNYQISPSSLHWMLIWVTEEPRNDKIQN